MNRALQTRAAGRNDRGAATVLVIGILAVILALGFAAMVIGHYAVAAHRARSSADLAAISGAVEFQRGGDVCATAGRVASANQARVVACDRVGDQLDFVVTVRVELAVAAPMPGLPAVVGAVAYAGVVS